MNEVELIIGLDKKEINLWRLANSQSASRKEWEAAALVLVTSLRRRRCRYTVKKLGYNAGV
jgi:hypothetical protein